MTRIKKASPSAQPRPEVTVEDGIAPIFAKCRIVYGDGKVALREIFTPVSSAEREGFLVAKAARELTDAELALHEKLIGLASEPQPAADPDAIS